MKSNHNSVHNPYANSLDANPEKKPSPKPLNAHEFI